MSDIGKAQREAQLNLEEQANALEREKAATLSQIDLETAANIENYKENLRQQEAKAAAEAEEKRILAEEKTNEARIKAEKEYAADVYSRAAKMKDEISADDETIYNYIMNSGVTDEHAAEILLKLGLYNLLIEKGKQAELEMQRKQSIPKFRTAKDELLGVPAW